MDIFALGGTGKEYEVWCDRLPVSVAHQHPGEMSVQALWTGLPFVLAGNQASIQEWFDNLDIASQELIGDHAFFWVLTSGDGFEHALIRDERLTVLDWSKREYNVITEALEWLARFPLMAGLSYELQHVREEIDRISSGRTEPATPVLILGESGSGKEGAAQSLFKASNRRSPPGFHAIGGAWLDMEPGLALAELFGIEGGAASNVKARSGLIETYSEGAIFVDDFDTAPKLLQERLLRITSTRKGETASYTRIGSDTERFTNVWLIFATNSNIRAMLQQNRMRPDFLFRFEDRVITVPPLRSRPADLPAIAAHIWRELVANGNGMIDDRVLPWKSLRQLSRRKLPWAGNIRELAALLGLVASMCRMPKHRENSTGALIDEVLTKGSGYFDWFGILTAPEFSAAPPLAPDVKIAQIVMQDAMALEDGLSVCEREVKMILGDEHWKELQLLVSKCVKRDPAKVSRRFCRCLVFVNRFGAIRNSDAEALTELDQIQSAKYLKWLAEGSNFLSPPTRETLSSPFVYGPGPYIR